MLEVIVAIIFNENKKILIAKRPWDKDHGGLWEFPGGKIENNESLFEALKRECLEELGLTVISAKPFIKVEYTYPKNKVLLHVWQVIEFSGTAFGKEKQEIKWVTIKEILNYQFPAANQEIILRLKE